MVLKNLVIIVFFFKKFRIQTRRICSKEVCNASGGERWRNTQLILTLMDRVDDILQITIFYESITIGNFYRWPEVCADSFIRWRALASIWSKRTARNLANDSSSRPHFYINKINEYAKSDKRMFVLLWIADREHSKILRIFFSIWYCKNSYQQAVLHNIVRTLASKGRHKSFFLTANPIPPNVVVTCLQAVLLPFSPNTL